MPEYWQSGAEKTSHLGVNLEMIHKRITWKWKPAQKLGHLWKCLALEIDEWPKGVLIAQLDASQTEQVHT